MNDYISREAVLEHYRVTDPAGTFAHCSSILEFVECIPAADVAEVVRCRECDFWGDTGHLQGRCALGIATYPTGAWYCANGRRKRNDV